MKSDQLSRLGYLAKFLWVIVVIVLALYFGREVIMPLIFAMFASFALLPICTRLESRGWGRGTTAFLLVSIFTLLLCGLIFIIGFQAVALTDDLPTLIEGGQKIWSNITGELEELNLPDNEALLQGNENVEALPIIDMLSESLSAIISTFTFFTVTPFYMFFILLYRANFRTFLISISKDKEARENNFEMMSAVADGIKAYLKGLSLVILFIAAANSIVYLALGLKYAILLAVVSAILTLIPYIGVFIGAVIPALIAFITKDSLMYPLVVIISAAVIQFIEGNFLTPKIIGDKAKLNPMFILFFISLMGLVGGILGMILAAPLITVIKICSEYYAPMQPIAFLLSSERDKEDKKP